MKLTPWFPGHIKPVREGVYHQMSGSGERVGYQYWNGFIWSKWCETPEQAKREKRFPAAGGFQNDSWRGVAK